MALSTGGVKIYRHVQAAPSATWAITHNLGGKVISEFWVFDSSAYKKAFLASIVHQSDNELVVTWTSPRAGYATLLRDNSAS